MGLYRSHGTHKSHKAHRSLTPDPLMANPSPADLAALDQRAVAELGAAVDESALRAWNQKYFGKQGEIALALRRVGEVPAADRKTYGQEANRIKEALTKQYEDAVASADE